MPRLSKIGAAALAAFGWTGLNTVSASYLVVAGGGGGGIYGGGGGAGGFRTGTAPLDPTLSYTVTVGAGGVGTGTQGVTGVSGNDSVFSTITSTGGGGGGVYGSGTTGSVGLNGGSGGGGGSPDTGGTVSGAGGSGNTPSTSPSQGNNGGTGTTNNSTYRTGGGGGGATSAGSNGGTTNGGDGGAGTASSISGSSVTYAGGGGGGTNRPSAGGAGGAGGGGTGGVSSGNGSNGTVSLGGGGGGAGGGTGGTGGSGIVIISYVGAQQFGGGVVTSSGGNTIHTFTTSGTLSPIASLSASYLIVAGGGGGACLGGGGGAGGMLTGSSLTLDTNSIYAISVGAGGNAGTNGVDPTAGTNSTFSMVTAAIGGGKGGGNWNVGNNGGNGGSGGGGGNGYGTGLTGGTGTSGQGNNGGTVASSASPFYSGAGGGAGAAGSGASTPNNGGVGLQSSITGTSTYYAGGGAGTGWATSGGTAGTGGLGGGGSGTNNTTGGSGSANTGGGGGASGYPGSSIFPAGGAGGSGIVIISYPGTTQLMAGGTVTVAGGNVIHTFTSSGYLTPIVLVNNSLRFRSSASAYLNRTPASATNRRTWTWSGWVKRGSLSASSTFFFAGNTTGAGDYNGIRFRGDDVLALEGYAASCARTTAVFRDPSAWYHIVFALDTTQATATDRLKIYVNGVNYSYTQYAEFPAQNGQLAIDNSVPHNIGRAVDGAGYFDGYLAEVNFIDGQALTPNSFGTSNGLGVWQPIRYGGSYGTNGFYLPFTATQSFTGIFSGSSQWISVPNLAAYNVGTNNYTVEGWFYITSLASTQGLWGCNNGSGSTPKFLGLVNTSGAVLLEFTNSGGATFLTSSSGVVTTNKWHHIAWVRNSGTSTIYVNGINVGSTATSVNLSGLTQAWNIGYIGESGPSSLTGNASNFRLVTGTAVYTSNFIPQTTPLTAISGTQILTLQNATLVDNSTNAQVVTNNGGVTVGATYPFAMLNDVVKDFGPAGNNWTANNIGETTGSTLDTMTDVPTLTSATTANYCVFNPTIANTTNLINGNLTRNGAVRTNVGTMVLTNNKYYFETTIQDSNGNGGVGVKQSTAYPLENYDTSKCATYFSNGEYKIEGGSQTSGFSSFTNGDVIGIAVDTTQSPAKIWFAKNNTWQGTGNPTTAGYSLTSGLEYYFMVLHGSGSSSTTASVNFGQQPFTYTPPTGFVALNTFNLPTPTIGATASTTANKYMDATLYTGAGNTSTSITNAGGFQPDFVWTKARSIGYSNYLYDAVRGTGTSASLVSNGTGAEGADATNANLSSFNSNGWTIGTTSGTNALNASGQTFVAWQWRASNATAVTNTSGSINSTVSANTTAGFSIVTYTGNGANSTVGHGLGVAPSMVIVKMRSAGGNNWQVYHSALGQNKILQLDLTTSVDTITNYWYNGTTSTVFGVNGSYSGINSNGATYVAYCFAQVAGYSAFGSYTGNGSSDGPFIYTGFRPRFVLIKCSSGAGTSWIIYDSARNTYNATTSELYPNTSGAETNAYAIDLLSNGFKIRNGTTSNLNDSGSTQIYAAFAESPFKYANAE